MSEGHYTLEVYPDMLRNVARQVGELREQLKKSGQGAGNQPGAIGDAWKGSAATDIKGAMTDLGTLIGTFDGRLQPVAEGARTLATTYQEALDQLPSLNRRWNAANDAYDEAVRSADRALDKGKSSGTPDKPLSQFERNELKEAHGTAVGTAASDRATAHRNLDYEYGQMKQWLAGETRKLETVLAEAGPVTVTDDQIAQWNAGEGPTISPAALYGDLPLMQQRVDRLAEIEEQELQARAVEDSGEDLQDLYSALDDNDADAVADALDEIGDHADDERYSDALLQQLGPDGVRDLYREINQRSNDNELAGSELYDNLAGLNDAIASGMSRLDDVQLNGYYDSMAPEEADSRILALLASSDFADGRLNTIALSVQRPALTYPATMPSDVDFFVMALQEAYPDGELGTTAIEQWVERSDAGDLAAVLKGLEPGDEVTDFFNGFNPADVSNSPGSPGVYDDEIPNELADRYGKVLDQLRDELNEEVAQGDPGDGELLSQLLNDRQGLINQYDPEVLAPYLKDIALDPAFTSWYLDKLGRPGAGEISVTHLQDLLRETDVDFGDTMAGVVDYRLEHGVEPNEVAKTLGRMLRTDELAGEDYDTSGLVNALVDQGLSMLPTSPVTGPIRSILGALAAGDDKINEMLGEAGTDERHTRENEMIAFQLYTQINDGPPPGFNDYVRDHSLTGDPEAIYDYLDHLRSPDGDHPGALSEIQEILDGLDDGRGLK